MIALDDKDEFHFVSGLGGIDPALLPQDHATAEEGAIFEAAPARTALMQEIASRIATTRGAALNIDYGHLESGFGDTLQAMLKHSFDDVFAHPGKPILPAMSISTCWRRRHAPATARPER